MPNLNNIVSYIKKERQYSDTSTYINANLLNRTQHTNTTFKNNWCKYTGGNSVCVITKLKIH